MASAKEIRKRIKSISNTKQIISAYELISVIKMQKAVANNLASRAFSHASMSLISDVCQSVDPSLHPFLQKREGNRKLVVLITSDRGLCGGLNVRALKLALEEAKDGDTTFVAIGKKGRDFLSMYGYPLAAEFSGYGDNLQFKKVLPIIQLVTDEYLAKNYDQVKVLYTHFESSLSQVPKLFNLLPFDFKDAPEVDHSKNEEIIFEPSKNEIIKSMIPRMLETQLWQVLLESVASEHSARMVAMKNANENAEDLLYDLTLTFNQTRQAGITREIAEISAGKMTLEG